MMQVCVQMGEIVTPKVNFRKKDDISAVAKALSEVENFVNSGSCSEEVKIILQAALQLLHGQLSLRTKSKTSLWFTLGTLFSLLPLWGLWFLSRNHQFHTVIPT